MNPPVAGVKTLHQPREGRIFCRQVRAGSSLEPTHSLLIGVVAVPKECELERMHLARINSHLWLDVENATSLPPPIDEFALDSDASALLRCLKFRHGALQDVADLFVRETMLPHENPALRWVYLIGAAASRLESMPSDGLYAVGSSGVTLISCNPYTGDSPSCILREAIWGPRGDTGFATSMEPKYYEQWRLGERQSNFRHDANFEPFVTLMGELSPSKMVYTAREKEEREKTSRRVLEAVMAAADRFHDLPPDSARPEYAAFVTSQARAAIQPKIEPLSPSTPKRARARP